MIKDPAITLQLALRQKQQHLQKVGAKKNPV
jgi:hypothetical protein